MEAIAALPDPDPHPWMREICALRRLLTEREGTALLARWMEGSRGPRWPTLCSCVSGMAGRGSAGFPSRWLGGDDALVATAEAVDEAARLLARGSAACRPSG